MINFHLVMSRPSAVQVQLLAGPPLADHEVFNIYFDGIVCFEIRDIC